MVNWFFQLWPDCRHPHLLLHCTYKGCEQKPIRKEEAEYIFVEYLKSIEPSEEILSNFLEDLKEKNRNSQKDMKLMAKWTWKKER